ncbi:MAG: ABC transporter permease [bacterium]|nr:ABC transporter permease [bacterium]
MKIGRYRLGIEQRIVYTSLDAIKIAVFSVVLAFIFFSLFFWLEEISPIKGYFQMFSYAFGTSTGIELTIRRMTFMLLVTLAFIFPHRAGVLNIGATGQLYAGMLAAIGIGLLGKSLDSMILIPLMVSGAILGGGALAVFVAYLRAKMNVNEIVVALMLNSIMFYFVKYLIEGPWMDPSGRPESAQLVKAARIPMIPGTSVPYTIFLAIAIAVLLYFILAKTATGYEIRLTGANPVSARYAGVSFLKIALITMLIGGAIAGIAGVHQTAGIRGVFKIHRYFAVYPGTWAYYGIVFGLISVSNPLAAIFVTFFFSGMQVGTQALQSRLGIGFGADLAFVGILMILLVAGQYFYHKKIVWLKIGNRGRPKGKKT